MMILVKMIMMMIIKMNADNKTDENRTSPKILNPIAHGEAKLYGVLGAFLSAIRLIETNDLIFHLVYPQSHLS